VKGDRAPGDRRGSGAAVGLQHIAIDADGPLAERAHVHAGAETAANQALYLLGSPTQLPSFAGAAGVRRTRQHRVFSSDPAGSAPTSPAGHALFYRSHAEDPRVSHRDETGALGVARDVAGDLHLSKLRIDSTGAGTFLIRHLVLLPAHGAGWRWWSDRVPAPRRRPHRPPP
jgi:hypothetical protein